MWYENSNSRKFCIEIAITLINRYPDARFLSLGQSLAWIVKVINLISDINRLNIETGYIPFSGSFYSPTDYRSLFFKDFKNKSLVTKFTRNPDIVILDRLYKDLLKNIGASVLSIINENKRRDKKTILLEYVTSGSGLASFLSILVASATKIGMLMELNEALKIIVFIENSFSMALKPFGIHNFKIVFDETFIPIYCEIYDILDRQQGEILQNLATSIDFGKQSDRLIPSYKYNMWDKLPLLSNKHSKNIKEIEYLLMDEISISDNLA